MSSRNKDMSENYFLSLCENPLRFEPLRKMTNVFYDNKCGDIFTVVHSDDVTQIVTENFDSRNQVTYALANQNHIITIKFSPDRKILTVQKLQNSLDFVAFNNDSQCTEFSQSSRFHNAKILGFIWITNVDILYITNQGLELYQIIMEKRQAKCLKYLSMNICWFLDCLRTNFILLSISSSSPCFQPLYVHDRNFNKMSKFEVEEIFPAHNKTYTIHERDVTVALVYNEIRVLILQHAKDSIAPFAVVVVYTINKMIGAKKTHVLHLNLRGRFALNVIDDLIIVHHQTSKTSCIFDIKIGTDNHNIIELPPIVEPTCIKITTLDCDLYSTHWITFQPNVIIDVGIGALWHLEINLQNFLRLVNDPLTLCDFLMHRRNGKNYVIMMVNEILRSEGGNLETVGKLFNKFNAIYKEKLEFDMRNQVGLSTSCYVTLLPLKLSTSKVVIDQSDIYSDVLTKLYDHRKTSAQNGKYLIWVLTEYLRSLADSSIAGQHFLHELLINTLIYNKWFQQLHHMLQYHVIPDTKAMACLLLSLENLYPASHQLALDMLHRISNSTEEITEVLLSKQQVVTAIRFNSAKKEDNELSYRKYLEVAKEIKDPRVFYSVFKEFNKKEPKLCDKSQLTEGHCDQYIQLFNERYHHTDEK